MGSTKFVVVKAKELIKTAVFALLGIVIIVGLITFFLRMGTDKETGMYRDGTYYGEMETGSEITKLAVEIRNGAIAEVSVEDPVEAVTVFYPLLESAVKEVGEAVVETQSLSVEIPAEKLHSAQLVLDAIASCLEKAEK